MAQRFVDRFDRVDVAMFGTTETDWVTYQWYPDGGPGGGGAGVASINAGTLQNGVDGAGGGDDRQLTLAQVGTVMDTEAQRVRADVMFNDSTDDADAQIAIGWGFWPQASPFHGDGVTEPWEIADSEIGVGILLDLDTGTAQLFDGGIGQTTTVPVIKTAFTDASVASVSLGSGTTGLLREKNSSIYGVWQTVEVTGEIIDGGLLLRGYVNGYNRGSPTLEVRVPREKLSNDTKVRSGFVFFGSHSPTSEPYHGGLRVGSFLQEDFSAISQPSTSDYIDQPTLGEVLDQAYLLAERSTSQPDLNRTDHGKLYANWTQRDLINHCGNMSMFLRHEDIINLSVDANGYVLLPEKVRRVMHITRETEPWATAGFHVMSRQQNGRLWTRLDTQTSGNYRVTYLQNWEDANEEEDRMFIPRYYIEALVTGTAWRIIRSSSDRELRDQIKGDYFALRAQMLREMNAEFMQLNPYMRVEGNMRGVPRHESSLWHFGY